MCINPTLSVIEQINAVAMHFLQRHRTFLSLDLPQHPQSCKGPRTKMFCVIVKSAQLLYMFTCSNDSNEAILYPHVHVPTTINSLKLLAMYAHNTWHKILNIYVISCNSLATVFPELYGYCCFYHNYAISQNFIMYTSTNCSNWCLKHCCGIKLLCQYCTYIT